MLIHLKNVLTADELARGRALLHSPEAPWIDGRRSAGAQAAQQKSNEQLAQDSAMAAELRQLVLGALRRDALLFSAALPRRFFNPLFNRYRGQSNHYGNHIDGAVLDYVARLLEVTRDDPQTSLGASVRGGLALVRCARVLAAASGRGYVVPDDIKELAIPVLAHRLIPSSEARLAGRGPEDVVRDLVARVPVPTVPGEDDRPGRVSLRSALR